MTEITKPKSIISLEQIIHPVPLTFIVKPFISQVIERKRRLLLREDPYTSTITNEEIDVGWEQTELLERQSPQKSIGTKGIDTCYIVCGISDPVDIVLGHYNSTQHICNETLKGIEQKLASQNADIPIHDFSMFTLPGPNNPRGTDTRFHDYDFLITRNPMSIIITAYAYQKSPFDEERDPTKPIYFVPT